MPIDLKTALKRAVAIAEEARQEWDAAPSGMRAGKILIALSGGCPGYRKDVDEIHEALSAIQAKCEKTAANLWARDNPGASVFDCDEAMKERYRALVSTSTVPTVLADTKA